jgi:hypothetical protein
MKKPGNKTFVLIVGGVSILIIMVLIAGLGNLAFKPAVPFAYRVESPAAIDPGEPPSWNSFIYVIVVIAIVLVVIFFLLPPDLRKKYLWGLARLILIGLVLFLVLSQISSGRPIAQPTQGAGGFAVTIKPENTDTPAPQVTPVEYIPPEVSPWVSYGLALVFLMIVVGIGWWMLSRRKQPASPYAALAEIARTTLVDLEAGRDWGDAVQNCYYRMTRAVQEWRGIQRRESMTALEFAGYLASAGLPGEAVNRLTGVFERVRFGGKKTTPEDIKEATDCLTKILAFCEAAQ